MIPTVSNIVRWLCRKPYHGHPKGCPNWGKRATCPPGALLLANILDLRKPIYVIYNRFPFGAHVAKMRAVHPEWSKRQVECCLYWQGTARKQLKARVREFALEHAGYKVLYVPEACGVNVTATMRLLDIELEWPPVTVAYQVALAGTPKEMP